MAMYKYGTYLTKSEDQTFDEIHKPGQKAIRSGIYRCMGCHREVTSEQGNSLPPQNHHTHSAQQGDIRWKMIVYADHREKT